jgi:Zn-dependent protease
MSDPLTWSPISLGRWLGTTVRVHFLLIAFVVFELVRVILFNSAEGNVRQTACWLGLLLAALALHEAGHAVTAWWYDTDQDVVRIWPLGNLVGPVFTPRLGRPLLVSMAGPVTSGAFFLGSALALHFGWGARLVWNPLGNEGDPGSPILAGGGPADPLSPVWFVGWFGYLNYVLTLANLIPALPFDGGRMFRAYLAGTSIDAGRDQLYAPTTARACAIVLGLAGLVRLFFSEEANGLTLVALAAFIWLYVRAEGRLMEDGGFLAEGVFGYDFSQGYTSLESSAAKVRPQPSPESPLTRWRRRRTEARRQRMHEREEAEEQRMDQILDKLYREGRNALTGEERRFLVRVSARYRNRSKLGG